MGDAFYEALYADAIPADADQADRVVLEAALEAAANITHEAGTWSGSLKAALHTFRSAMAKAGERAGVDLGAALDALADLRDKLDAALLAGEQHRAARGRAVNAAQIALSSMERARDAFMRLGALDEADCLQWAIKRLQEDAR